GAVRSCPAVFDGNAALFDADVVFADHAGPDSLDGLHLANEGVSAHGTGYQHGLLQEGRELRAGDDIADFRLQAFLDFLWRPGRQEKTEPADRVETFQTGFAKRR